MLIQFQCVNGPIIAINPKFVLMVRETPVGVDIIMVDGGTNKINGDYLTVVGQISGQLRD